MALTATAAVAEPWPREDTPSTIPTKEIARPDYAPSGIRVGDFKVLPLGLETLALDDNIFATRDRPRHDVINTTAESLAWTSDWSRHRWSGRLSSDQQVYVEHYRESANTYAAESAFRLDTNSRGFVELGASFTQQPQARASIEANTTGDGRAIFNTASGTTSFVQRFNRLTERIQANLRKVDYTDDDDSNRDKVVKTYRNRTDYRVTERLGVMAEVSDTEFEWARRSELRNSSVITALVGGTVEIPTVIKGEIGFGFARQLFKNEDFERKTSPILRGDILWNVRPLTSVLLSVDRTLQGTETFCSATTGTCETNGITFPALTFANQRNELKSTEVQAAVQHEFWHSLLGEVKFRYERAAFDFNGLVDKTYETTAGAQYLINRNLELSLAYTHRSRVANLPLDRTFNSGPFTENILFLTLRAALSRETLHFDPRVDSYGTQPPIALGTTTGIDIGVDMAGYSYRERNARGMKTDSLRGPRIGPSVAATFSFGSGWFVAGDGRLSFGLLDYEGDMGDHKDGNEDALWDVRVRGGKDFFFENVTLLDRTVNFSVSPFIGLGLRAVSTDLRGRTDAGVMGYRFHNEFAYAAIGVTPRFRLDSESRISTDLEYDQLIIGRTRSYRSDVGPGFQDSTGFQHRGYGVRGAVRYETDSWAVGPFATFWSVADPSRYYFEPRNTSWEGGIRTSYRF